MPRASRDRATWPPRAPVIRDISCGVLKQTPAASRLATYRGVGATAEAGGDAPNGAIRLCDCRAASELAVAGDQTRCWPMSRARSPTARAASAISLERVVIMSAAA